MRCSGCGAQFQHFDHGFYKCVYCGSIEKECDNSRHEPVSAELTSGIKDNSNHGIMARLSAWNKKRQLPPTQQEIDYLRLKSEKEKYRYQYRYYRNAQSELNREKFSSVLGSGNSLGSGMGELGFGSILQSKRNHVDVEVRI